mgnify:CR=1 FL=1
MAIYLKWSLQRLVKSICDRLLNRFDVFIIIEGRRGLGKSTLGYKLMLLVRREMKRRGVVGYQFKPRRDLLYQRKEVLKFFHDWKRSGMADEMINVTFNRDFYNEDQKDVIKMINMNRDHNNFFVACVPQFKNLDSQIKNLCSMKITVVRRGTAIIHMPNRTVYSSDIWDERFNEKIERAWLKGGISNPRYSRLTTFRGFLNFPKLTEQQELLYQSIKDEKRNVIAQDKGLEDVDDRDPFEVVYKALLDGKVKNTAMLEGMMVAHDLNIDSTKSKLRRVLKENSKSTKLTHYYFDDQEYKKEEKQKRKQNELTALISQVKSQQSDINA